MTEFRKEAEKLEGPAKVELLLKIKAEERQARDDLLKVLTLILGFGTAVAAIAGLYLQMTSNERLREQELLARQKEYASKYYEKQLSMYSRLCELAADCVLEPPGPETLQQLETLYLSEIYPLGDPPVTAAVELLLIKVVSEVEGGQGLKRRFNDGVDPKPPESSFGRLYADIVEECRNALLQAFPDISIGRGRARLPILNWFDLGPVEGPAPPSPYPAGVKAPGRE